MLFLDPPPHIMHMGYYRLYTKQTLVRKFKAKTVILSHMVNKSIVQNRFLYNS